MADLDRLVTEVEIDVTTKGADAAKHTAADVATMDLLAASQEKQAALPLASREFKVCSTNTRGT